jgi:[protein-PII] uridylyltransferase
LFEATRTRLDEGIDQAPDLHAHARRTREQAIDHLGPIDRDALSKLWSSFPDAYFLKQDPDQLAWHADAIMRAPPGETLVAARQNKRRGTTEIFVHVPDQDGLFATIAEGLDRLRLDVVQARIFTSDQRMAVDTFQVLHGEAGERDPDRIAHLLMRDLLQPGGLPAPTSRRLPRRMRHFALKTRVTFGEQTDDGHSMLEIVASDRPGLLSQIAGSLVECGIRIHSAKIASFGNRVEDFFFVTDRHRRPLSSQAQKDSLRQALIRKLDNEND